MTDPYLRLLRAVAKQQQLLLDHHHTFDHIGDTPAAADRCDLRRAADRTKATVAPAEPRRRHLWLVRAG
jgi:hypothetical protein